MTGGMRVIARGAYPLLLPHRHAELRIDDDSADAAGIVVPSSKVGAADDHGRAAAYRANARAE